MAVRFMPSSDDGGRAGSCVRRRSAARRRVHLRTQGVMTSTKLGEATSRWHAVRRFIRARIDRKSELGLRLTVNVILFGGAIWAFAGLLEEVLDKEALVEWDVRVNAWAHAHATAAGLRFFHAVTLVGSPGVWVITALFALWLFLRHERFLFWAWIASNLGGGILQLVLKLTIHRDRPQYGAGYLHGQSYSFPSGHTMSATICWSLMVVCAGLSLGWHDIRRAQLHVVAATVIFLIGFSRLYLGVHYPSDVLGGLIIGTAWVVLCTTAIRLVDGGEAEREREEGQRVSGER
jgi:membrane-associated phospholipid phosphatase